MYSVAVIVCEEGGGGGIINILITLIFYCGYLEARLHAWAWWCYDLNTWLSYSLGPNKRWPY